MKESLGNRIQQLRKQAGFTQIELAEKIGVSKLQLIRYEGKDVQPPANIISNLANTRGTSVNFLISRDKTEKGKASLKNSGLFQRFKDIDTLPEAKQNVIIKVISAYIYDFKVKQAYAS